MMLIKAEEPQMPRVFCMRLEGGSAVEAEGGSCFVSEIIELPRALLRSRSPTTSSQVKSHVKRKTCCNRALEGIVFC